MQPSDSASADASGQPGGDAGDRRMQHALVWIGVGVSVAGLGAAVAYTIVRAMLGGRRTDDPTSQRIAQLIDEANSLLRTLDEQRNAGNS